MQKCWKIRKLEHFERDSVAKKRFFALYFSIKQYFWKRISQKCIICLPAFGVWQAKDLVKLYPSYPWVVIYYTSSPYILFPPPLFNYGKGDGETFLDSWIVYALEESRNVNPLYICHIGRFQNGISIPGIEQFTITFLDSWMVYTLEKSRNV